ncbi:MAG: DeoR/GlpR family DNA-binding transcription regulator [Actinomycetaceae bacterium]|nr:DeoR/GlpR family DNA-binding transcription regulator [Actinomycetaceae bacterium]
MSEPSNTNERTTPSERQSLIVEGVLSDGALRIDDIASRLGVSPVTVYRDVQVLEETGVVERVKGEVRVRASSTAELPPQIRKTRSPAEKAVVARAAIDLVAPGDAILIDDSSTALPLLTHLRNIVPLTIITNSLTVADTIRDWSEHQLVLIGGRYQQWAHAFYGTLAVSQVKELRADMCFMSDAAVWAGAIYNPVDYVIDMKRAMLAQATRRTLMIDSSKFARHAWQKTAPLDSFDTIIVDEAVTDEQLSELEESGATVIVAG